MNNARNAEIRRQRCYENNCPDRRQNPNGTTRNTPIAEWGACRRTCLEEFPYTPYELDIQQRQRAFVAAFVAAAVSAEEEARGYPLRGAALETVRIDATVAAYRTAAFRAIGAELPPLGGGKNRKSRKTRRRSIRR